MLAQRGGWVGLGCVLARAKGGVPRLDRLDWIPTSGCLVSQPPRRLTILAQALARGRAQKWGGGGVLTGLSEERGCRGKPIEETRAMAYFSACTCIVLESSAPLYGEQQVGDDAVIFPFGVRHGDQ